MEKKLLFIINRLKIHLSEFDHFFKNKPILFFDKAKKYTQGIVKTKMRNIESISKYLITNYHQMIHVVSVLNWKGFEINDRVVWKVIQSFLSFKLTTLQIDGSGWFMRVFRRIYFFLKFMVSAGKKTNSQSVFLDCANKGDFDLKVNAGNYLPKNWSNAPLLCNEVWIPKDKREFKTKLKLVVDIICPRVSQGIMFNFISSNGFRLNYFSLVLSINNNSPLYILDIQATQTNY